MKLCACGCGQPTLRTFRAGLRNGEYLNYLNGHYLIGKARQPNSGRVKGTPNKYTGNGVVVISGLCPDFTNCNGQKKVIEMFGDYWHKGQNPQDRIDKFESFGFGCLVIWESEIKDEELVKIRIREFNRS